MEKAFDFIAQNKVIVKQIVIILVWIHVAFALKGKLNKIDMLGLLNFHLLILYIDIHASLSKTGGAQATIDLFSVIYFGFLFIYMITLIILFRRHLKSNEPNAQAKGIKNKFKTERQFRIAVVEVAMVLLMLYLW